MTNADRAGDSSSTRPSGDTVTTPDSGLTGTVHLHPEFPPNRVELSGSVDITLSAHLAEVVRDLEVRGGPVEIDAAGVTFMDSATLALLAHLAYQHPVRLIDPPKAVTFLLETTRLVEVMEVSYSGPRPAASA